MATEPSALAMRYRHHL